MVHLEIKYFIEAFEPTNVKVAELVNKDGA